jgi:uncharacterized protein (TIGR03437 family)
MNRDKRGNLEATQRVTDQAQKIDPPIKLIGIYRAELERADRLRNLVLGIQIVIAVFACGGGLINTFPPATYVLTVLTVLGAIAWARNARIQTLCRNHAERLRRAAIFVWGYGKPLFPQEFGDLLAQSRSQEAAADALADPKFFSSETAPGLRRFTELVEESVFRASHLARASAMVYWSFMFVSFVFLIVVLVALPFGNRDFGIVVAKLVCSALVLLVSSDFLGTAFAFSDSAQALEHIDTRLQGWKRGDGTSEEILFIFGNYNSAVEGAPTVPDWIRRRNQARLDQIWSARNANPNPTISGVTNSASSAAGAIAPGEIVAVKGNDLGPTVGIHFSPDLKRGEIDITLAGTRVLFDSVAAPVIYTSLEQVNAIVPYEISDRSQTTIQVEYQGIPSAGLMFPVQKAAPGVFTSDNTGIGQAAALNDGSKNGAVNPAARGSYVSIYVTGCGQTEPAGVSGSLSKADTLKRYVENVTATVGGVQCAVDFAGSAPTFVDGFGQVNILLAEATPPGEQPIIITVGGISSPATATLAVAQ